jgi:hypothetical protein
MLLLIIVVHRLIVLWQIVPIYAYVLLASYFCAEGPVIIINKVSLSPSSLFHNLGTILLDWKLVSFNNFPESDRSQSKHLVHSAHFVPFDQIVPILQHYYFSALDVVEVDLTMA